MALIFIIVIVILSTDNFMKSFMRQCCYLSIAIQTVSATISGHISCCIGCDVKNTSRASIILQNIPFQFYFVIQPSTRSANWALEFPIKILCALGISISAICSDHRSLLYFSQIFSAYKFLKSVNWRISRIPDINEPGRNMTLGSTINTQIQSHVSNRLSHRNTLTSGRFGQLIQRFWNVSWIKAEII